VEESIVAEPTVAEPTLALEVDVDASAVEILFCVELLHGGGEYS